MKYIKYFFTELGGGIRDIAVDLPRFIKKHWKTIIKYLIFWLIIIAAFAGLYFIVPIKIVGAYFLGLVLAFVSFIFFMIALYAKLEDNLMYSLSKKELKIIVMFVGLFFATMALICLRGSLGS